MLEGLLALFVFGTIGMMLVGVALLVMGAMLAAAMAITGFLLFKILPLLLLAFLGWKLIARMTRRQRNADECWLDI